MWFYCSLLRAQLHDIIKGANIGWLSVYPNEQEALYPPLTYLRSVKAENESIGGLTILVATVEPVFM